MISIIFGVLCSVSMVRAQDPEKPEEHDPATEGETEDPLAQDPEEGAGAGSRLRGLLEEGRGLLEEGLDILEVPSGPAAKVQAVLTTPPSAGSLWNDNTTRMLIGMEGNARMKGDLITVVISEQTSAKVSAGTMARKESMVSSSIGSLFGIRKKITDANPSLGGELGMEASNSAEFDGDANTSRAGKLEGMLTCRVVDVHTNGNLVIFGWKEVRSNRETQYLSLSGLIRPQDISANNTVLSHLLADSRIEYTGAGVVSDKQGPGVGTRVMDNIWPF
jgi:flagellar L-ring protein precursor FlgH